MLPCQQLDEKFNSINRSVGNIFGIGSWVSLSQKKRKLKQSGNVSLSKGKKGLPERVVLMVLFFLASR